VRQALRPPSGPLVERNTVTMTIELEVVVAGRRTSMTADAVADPGRLAARAVSLARAAGEPAADGLVLSPPPGPVEAPSPVAESPLAEPMNRDAILDLLDAVLAGPGSGPGRAARERRAAGAELTDELVRAGVCWHTGARLSWDMASRRLWTWLDGPGGDLLEGSLTWGQDLPAAGAVARRRDEFAVLQERAVPVPRQAVMPVLFAPNVAIHFVNAFAGLFSGAAAKGPDDGLPRRIGRRIANRAAGLTDDARVGQGPWGRPIDAEGTPTRRATVIEQGVLTGLLHTRKTARVAGADRAGQAVRRGPDQPVRPGPTGFRLEPGTEGVPALRGCIDDGFEAVTPVRVPRLDRNGVLHAQVLGWPVRSGERGTEPYLAEIAVGVYSVLRSLVACGPDLLYSTTFRGIAAPAVLVDGVSLGAAR
jgi:PmbA protein